MEVNQRPATATWEAAFRTLPPKNHPNYRLWANYSRFAPVRGSLVSDILSSFVAVDQARILDLGCGDGGAAFALAAKGARLTALDFNPVRIQKLKQQTAANDHDLTILTGDAHGLPFRTATFDAVILQDVLEHLPHPEQAVAELARVLKPNGYVYLSTPNRWSPLNFLSDPHWNLPLLAALPRKAVSFVVTKLVRRENLARPDFAALLSLFRVRRMFHRTEFELQFLNRRIARALFSRPTAVVNSDIHLKIVNGLKRLKLAKLVIQMVNDKFGLFNFVLNPTWYLIGKKRGSVWVEPGTKT
ncbi:MAG: class I SAM-dependent methyltransferase [bacterium]